MPHSGNFIVSKKIAKNIENKETNKACRAPKNNGKSKYFIKFPINIMCNAQKSAHKITKPSPNLTVAFEKSLNK